MAAIGSFVAQQPHHQETRDALSAAAALHNQTHLLHSAQRVQESIAQRIATVEVAERQVSRREQLVSVREAVLRQALAAAPRGGKVQEREREIHDMVLRAAASLPPPVSVAGFVEELEGRAVELECALHQAGQQTLAAAAEARLVVAMKAGLQRKEEELEAKALRHQEVWRELRHREALQATRARELEQHEAELERWAARLRETERELLAAAATPSSSSVLQPAERRRTSSGDQVGEGAAPTTLDGRSEGATEAEDPRAALVEVAQYLEARHVALRAYESWLVERAAAVESTLQLLDSVFAVSVSKPSRPAPTLPAERGDISDVLSWFVPRGTKSSHLTVEDDDT